MVSLLSCSSIRFYGQAAKGHLQLTLGKRDIERLIDSPRTDPALKDQLREVLSIRRFAVTTLQLPDQGSYTDYVDLNRDVTLWLLTAAPELSLTAEQWCYPIAGCLQYRGFFRQKAAQSEAARYQARGFDTAINPGLAYSTLGRMNDPVLNTMLAMPRQQLARTLFHELAHEQLYLKGEGTFNESYASAVAEIGVRRWLADQGSERTQQAFVAQMQRREQFQALLQAARDQLERLYASDRSDIDKRAAKRRILEDLKQRYHDYRQQHGLSGQHSMFGEGRPNNADLALVETYQSHVPWFIDLYLNCDEDLGRFYQVARTLAALDPADRANALAGEVLECS